MQIFFVGPKLALGFEDRIMLKTYWVKLWPRSEERRVGKECRH